MFAVDVGAHNGQTLEVLVDYPFEEIHAFEPMPDQIFQLRERFTQPNVIIHPYGLIDENCELPVYGANTHCEASIYPEKVDLDPAVSTKCSFQQASKFFATLPDGDVFVKMNCEGAEIKILGDLIRSGLIWRITHLTFDLDIRRVRGREAEADDLLAKLAVIGFDRYQVSSDAFVGSTHREKIEGWLAKCL